MLKSLVLGALLLLVIPGAVLASVVDVSVVDVTAPVGSVTLGAGDSGSITINMSVTGQQNGTATFKVYRDWTLSGGTWIGQNPVQFTVPQRSASAPPTFFSTPGTVSVAPGEANSTYTLMIGAFDITNTSTGGVLKAGQSSNYQVTVATPCAPGRPSLTLLYDSADWGSYANYQARELSVGWTVRNDGSETAYDVRITGNTNGRGVGLLTALPVALGSIASGSTASTTIKHSPPTGVGSYTSAVTGAAKDCAANSYNYP